MATSSSKTFMATAGMTGLCAVIQHLANGPLKLSLAPEEVLYIGACLTTLVHFLVNCFNAYISVDAPKFAAALKSEDTPAVSTQSGFASPILLGIMALIAVSALMLSGCASQLQAMSAANTSAVVSVRAEADLRAKIAAEAFCTMTVDTLARNTQYIGGVKALCWAGSVSTPSDAADQLIAPTGVNTAVIQAPVTPAPVTVTVSTPTVTPAPVPAKVPVKTVARVAARPNPVVITAPVVTPAPVIATPAPVITPAAPSLLSAPVIPK